MHCVNGSFPGINRDGGFAEFLLTSARSVVKLDPSLHPTDIAALADAGLTAIHAVKKAIPVTGAGTKTVVIGAGGLGHIGIQCLRAYTPTEIIVVDPNEKALALAKEMGAHHTVKVDGSKHVEAVKATLRAHLSISTTQSSSSRAAPNITTTAAWRDSGWAITMARSATIRRRSSSTPIYLNPSVIVARLDKSRAISMALWLITIKRSS